MKMVQKLIVSAVLLTVYSGFLPNMARAQQQNIKIYNSKKTVDDSVVPSEANVENDATVVEKAPAKTGMGNIMDAIAQRYNLGRSSEGAGSVKPKANYEVVTPPSSARPDAPLATEVKRPDAPAIPDVPASRKAVPKDAAPVSGADDSATGNTRLDRFKTYYKQPSMTAEKDRAADTDNENSENESATIPRRNFPVR